jgi:hypothetical protein
MGLLLAFAPTVITWQPPQKKAYKSVVVQHSNLCRPSALYWLVGFTPRPPTILLPFYLSLVFQHSIKAKVEQLW